MISKRLSYGARKTRIKGPLKLLAIWGTFSFGILIIVLAIAAILASERGSTDRREAIASLVLFGLGPIACGSWLAWDRHQHIRQTEYERLQNVFYGLVKRGQGRMSVLSFALEAGISGTEARAFLDARSREFQAQFDVTEQGEVIYRFDLGQYLA